MSEEKQLNKARQALVDRMLSRLDAGAIPWDSGMQGAAAPFNAISRTHYRGINLLNLMLAGKEDPRWLTFYQAKDSGYTVKKGAKGMPIELYKTIDKRTGKDADFAKIREEIKDMTFAERQAFKKENLQTFARSYYVFNASDVHGIEPYRAPELTPEDISARNERIEAVIAGSQAPIYYDGNGRNYYSPTSDKIHLTDRAAFTSDEFFYNTALHEMAHSTGHSSRLKRNMGDGFGSQSYAREELVAEISSVLTAAELGLNHSDRVIENSAEYVRSWAQLIRDNPQTLIDATFDASKATDYICESEHRREQAKEETQKGVGDDIAILKAREVAYAAACRVVNQNMRYVNGIDGLSDVLNAEKDSIGAKLRNQTLPSVERIIKHVPTEIDAIVKMFDENTLEQYGWTAENIRYDVINNIDDAQVKEQLRKQDADYIKTQNEIKYATSPIVTVEAIQESATVDKGAIKDSASYPGFSILHDHTSGAWYCLQDSIPRGEEIDRLSSRRLAIGDSARLGAILDNYDEQYRTKMLTPFDSKSEALEYWERNSKIYADIREKYSEANKAKKEIQSRYDYSVRSSALYFDEKAQKENVASAPTPPHAKPLMVNFYAGPSSGKTTAALELTAALKKAGYNVEYVSEYAKELVLENKLDLLNDQKHVTDEQYERFDRIRNSADVIVTDSPILLGLVYGEGKVDAEYAEQIRGYYDSFDNFNMLVTRPKDATFQTEGRVHDEKQSLELDGKIKSMLDTQKVFYGSYKRDDIAKTVERIGQTYNRLYGEQKGKTQKEKAVDIPPVPPKKSYEFKTNIDNIPDVMKALPNWVAFRTHEVYDEKKKEWKLKKAPITPNQPRAVSSSQYLKWADHGDPNTWSSFEKAVAFAKRWKLDGLAFAVQNSGMTCVDLDHHLVNGSPTELAQKFIDAAGTTYAEKSVSGTGLHIFYAGQMPQGIKNVNKNIDLEAYDKQRFISVTGNLYDNATKEVLPPSDAMTGLLKSNLKRVEHHAVLPSKPIGLSDNELIDLIRTKSSARDLRDFEAMWSGEDICGNRNVTDMKLCGMLAFYSNGDVGQVERCFKASGLYRPPPEKSAGYVHHTAQKACDGRRAEYDPKAYAQRMNPNRTFAKPNSKSGGRGSSGAGR